MRPPTFFLSSTIYDFKDLRSAIKYHLERQGYRVLASEHNGTVAGEDTFAEGRCHEETRARIVEPAGRLFAGVLAIDVRDARPIEL